VRRLVTKVSSGVAAGRATEMVAVPGGAAPEVGVLTAGGTLPVRAGTRRGWAGTSADADS
jgi:hypothetical protein